MIYYIFVYYAKTTKGEAYYTKLYNNYKDNMLKHTEVHLFPM